MPKFVLFVIALLAAGSAFAQTQVASIVSTPSSLVERPALKVGDSWTYQKIDNWNGSIVEKYTEEVSTVSDKIEIARKSEKFGTTPITLTLGRNELTGVSITKDDVVRYTPDNGAYSFPLNVGKSWAAKLDYAATNNRTGSYDLNVKVAGWEKIKTPAGEFTALKVVTEGYYTANTERFRIDIITWYVPEVKGMVRQEFVNRSTFGKLFNRFTIELAAYKLAD
jgi:hypothetical protein